MLKGAIVFVMFCVEVAILVLASILTTTAAGLYICGGTLLTMALSMRHFRGAGR